MSENSVCRIKISHFLLFNNIFLFFRYLFFCRRDRFAGYLLEFSLSCFVFDSAYVFLSSVTWLNPFEVLLELNFPALLRGVSLSFIYREIRENLGTVSNNRERKVNAIQSEVKLG